MLCNNSRSNKIKYTSNIDFNEKCYHYDIYYIESQIYIYISLQ